MTEEQKDIVEEYMLSLRTKLHFWRDDVENADIAIGHFVTPYPESMHFLVLVGTMGYSVFKMYGNVEFPEWAQKSPE